jgi:glycosyltransferase involved in cell wall biosynthesis
VKVHFDGIMWNSHSGPNTFANRLARGLYQAGHEIELSGPDADVSLVFIEKTGQPLARKVVQRLDGIWFKPDEFIMKNIGIKQLYETADAVVWQSEFDRNMTVNWWDVPHSGRIIHNGFDLSKKVTQFSSPELMSMRNKFDKIFVCSSNWHPQKRLKDNILMFKHLQSIHPNSCLIVMGANPDVRVADSRIFYTGAVPEEVYLQVYAMADWMIHLAWLDHCPNVVIEALSQETPVICSDSGGTKELVEGFGMTLSEAKPYSYELADYDNPPEIDVTQITSLPDKNSLTPHADIDIENVVLSYIELFDSVVHKELREQYGYK